MMGSRQVEQAALFYEFSLERHIATDHLLRSIDRFVISSRSGETSTADHRGWKIRKHARHRRQVADVAVDHAEERCRDCTLKVRTTASALNSGVLLD
jgi:hypothetical protein